MPAFRDRPSWYLGLSAYWFATSYKWFILLLVVLPGQVKEIVPGGEKNTYWGLVFATGAIWAIFGPALFGHLSDRILRDGTKPERRLFLSIGAGLTVIALFTLLEAKSLAMLAFGYLLLQISDDVGTGPYSAAIPELVPTEHRGKASGVMGMLNAGAQIVSAVVAIALGRIELIYIGIASVNVICAAWTIWTLKGALPVAPSFSRSEEEGIGRGAGAKIGFFASWLEPWKSADFRWVWFTRMLNALGLYMIEPYLKYYIEDRVADSAGKVHLASFSIDADKATLFLALLISATAVLGSLLGGNLTGRIGRKATIRRSAVLISAGLVPFALVPNYGLFVVVALVFGAGYGMYLTADWALAADVMPNKNSLAKDMGIWQSSVPCVQVFAGAVGALITFFNKQSFGLGYSVAFLLAAAAFFLSAQLVTKVKGST